MELYKIVAYSLSASLTRAYSTSFSMSSRLFDKSIRPDIYAIYGLVRIGDEIVDSYNGPDQQKQLLLDQLESQTYEAMELGYSSNPIVHAFCLSAIKYQIDRGLLAAFFASMRMDIGQAYQPERFDEYIYGSAEVVGLMCLKVFCQGDKTAYDELETGARLLGRAYQKVNFLRDIKDDYQSLGRIYFPGVEFDSFSDSQKRQIEQDILNDFKLSNSFVTRLPDNSRAAVRTSWLYYLELLKRIQSVSAETIKQTRVSVPAATKLALMVKGLIKRTSYEV